MSSQEIIDSKVESFSFFMDTWGPKRRLRLADISIIITMGDKQIASAISQESKNLQYLRKALEKYIAIGRTKIEFEAFESDTEKTKIILTRITGQGLSNDVSNEFKASKRGSVLVTVKVSEFGCKDRIVRCICDEREVLQQMYEAFLDSSFYIDLFRKSRMVSYNRFKSPLIEDFITGKRIKTEMDQNSRVNILHFLLIDADLEGCIWDEKWSPLSRAYNDTVKIWIYDDDDDKDIIFRTHLTGFQKWKEDFFKATDYEAHFIDEETFDVKTWNKRGLEIAAELRRQLPPYIDLWYRYPYEDRSHSGCRPVLIYNE